MSHDFRRPPPPLPGEAVTDYRTRFALEQNHAVETRRRQLAEQASTANTPDRRISLWEQIHALTLPADPDHALLAVIARDTELPLAAVHEEQKRRSAASATVSTGKDTREIWDPYCTHGRNGLRR